MMTRPTPIKPNMRITYQSGDGPLSRKHNVGFRLALAVGDLAPLVVSRLFQEEDTIALSAIEECA